MLLALKLNKSKAKMRLGIWGIILILFIISQNTALAYEGVIDPNYKYLWLKDLGWINFGCRYCDLKVTDSKITGYAWSENYGWINFSPRNGGVNNDGYGNLSGYAWSENLGWLNFDKVKINENGKFTGLAKGDNIIIDFDCPSCDVRTTWRPRNLRPQCNNGLDDDQDGKIDFPEDPGCSSLTDESETTTFIRSGSSRGSPLPPPGGFSVIINKGEKTTLSPIVELELNGGDFDTYEMAISNFPDFRDAIKEPYQKNKTWDLCSGRKTCDEGEYFVYVKFFTQQAKGFPLTSEIGSSPVVSSSIVYKKSKISLKLPILKITPKSESLSSVVIKKASQEGKGEAKSVSKARAQSKTTKELTRKEKAPLVFQGKWDLLTYTKTKANLHQFANPNLTEEIIKLSQATTQPATFFSLILSQAQKTLAGNNFFLYLLLTIIGLGVIILLWWLRKK